MHHSGSPEGSGVCTAVCASIPSQVQCDGEVEESDGRGSGPVFAVTEGPRGCRGSVEEHSVSGGDVEAVAAVWAPTPSHVQLLPGWYWVGPGVWGSDGYYFDAITRMSSWEPPADLGNEQRLRLTRHRCEYTSQFYWSASGTAVSGEAGGPWFWETDPAWDRYASWGPCYWVNRSTGQRIWEHSELLGSGEFRSGESEEIEC